jgi:hypothetical protein
MIKQAFCCAFIVVCKKRQVAQPAVAAGVMTLLFGHCRCVNLPKECSSQLRKKKKGSKPTYPTNIECCRPGMGAFADGCKA